VLVVRIVRHYGRLLDVITADALYLEAPFIRTVRVIWAEEHTVTQKIVGGQRRVVVEQHAWVWGTDLPPSVVPARPRSSAGGMTDGMWSTAASTN